MRSDATTVDAYLDELPVDRRAAIEEVRRVILDRLPPGYEETMNWGMITYQVPLDRYPDTYNGQPLMYAALASQKNYMALYLQAVYALPGAVEQFERDYRATGKRFDMGKSCVRFRTLDDLPLGLVGDAIAAVEVDEWVEFTERVRPARRRRA